MDKYIVIKNGLVQSFDSESKTGYFNIVIKNDRIFRIDYDNELNKESFAFTKYPGAHIIDAKDKLILPSFINPFLNSTHTLSRFFLNNSTYSNLNENISLNLIEKHFANPENKTSLKNLVAFTYFKSLYNGESSILDTSKLITKEFLIENLKFNFLNAQDVVFTAYDNSFNQFLDEHQLYHVAGIKNEEEINNYSLNSLKRFISTGNKKILLEVMQKSDSNEIFRQAFSKSLINVLKENDLLSSKTIFVNPVFVNSEDIETFGSNHVNIIFCPSDFVKFAERNFDIEEYLQNNVSISIGIGLTGLDMLSEVKLFSNILKRNYFSFENILRLITTNPAKTIEKSKNVGSIEEGKLANLIFFDLSVIHNLLNVPEIDSERVSEFIIESLTVKDISDVIVKGSFVKRNYQCRFYDPELLKQIHCTLIKKIYETGKYFEFKENYLRRKRIKELTNRASETKENIYNRADEINDADFLLTENEIITDSEFRIIGLHKADISLEPIDNFNTNSLRNVTIEELDSPDSGLKFFEDDEKIFEQNTVGITLDKHYAETKPSGKSNLKITPEKISGLSDSGKNDSGKSATEKAKEKAVFKKEKLRFGFSDEE